LRHPVAIGFGLVTLLAAATAQATDKPACKPAPLGTAQVRSVLDGRTVQLTDGREVRLAGIEVPQKHDSAAKAALESLVSGRDIALLRLGADSDRYGRVVALVSAEPGAAEIGQSVQRALLAQGQARVTANIGDSACAANLLEAERAARVGGLGLWADPYYVIRHAEDPAGVLAVRGRFAVVEGKVLSVRESGATIYVNFGRRWSDDFTVTVQKRNERSFTAAGLELKKLTGQHVRVRGTIEERGGPWIEAARPEQIEIAERGHE
jgi:endonuclease YncB( thermonuclease family)